MGIRSSLPFDGIHLLLDNDLSGAKVMVNPLVYDKPLIGQSPDLVEQEFPDLFPQLIVLWLREALGMIFVVILT